VSVELQYFFNSPLPLPELAAVINCELGCELKPYQGDETDYFTKLLGIDFSLGSDRFENDRELDFESFQYYVDLRTSWGAAGRRPYQLPLLLAIVYVLQHRLGYAGIVVYDMTKLLARYVERGSGPDRQFVDVLSGTSPLDYEGHLHAVWRRCPSFGKPDADAPNQAESNRP
jgi:hypothetical protein